MGDTNGGRCSCGCTEPHVVARRATLNGVTVCLWSDGAVTGRLGYAIAGVPVVRPKSPSALEAATRAGWMLMGEVEVCEASELGALYAACRWAAARDAGIAAARDRLAERDRPTINPVWTVVRADRDGRPTERVWRLPRMRWPGLVVWDRCSGPARYEVAARVPGASDTYTATGFAFGTLGALAAHLHATA